MTSHLGDTSFVQELDQSCTLLWRGVVNQDATELAGQRRHVLFFDRSLLHTNITHAFTGSRSLAEVPAIGNSPLAGGMGKSTTSQPEQTMQRLPKVP